MTTLKQIVTFIDSMSTSHQQIKTIFHGNIVDFLSKGEDNIYPAFVFDYDNALINGRSMNINFSFYFFDRVLPEQTNELEVINDQLQIAGDIFGELRFEQLDDMEISENIQINFFRNETPDVLAGVSANVQISVPFNWEHCLIPSAHDF